MKTQVLLIFQYHDHDQYCEHDLRKGIEILLFLLLQNIDEVVSWPLGAWKKGRALADITTWFDALLWAALYFKSLSFPNFTRNSCKLSIHWYTHIAITATSLSIILASILLFDWADWFFARRNTGSSVSSIVHGTKSVRCQMIPNFSS